MQKIDFGLNWSGTLEENFVQFIQKFCKEKKISFIWVNEDNVQSVLKKFQGNKILISVLLDTEATYNKKGDIYAKIAYS